MRNKLIVAGIVLALVILGICLEPTRVVVGTLLGERFAASRPTAYWKRALLSGDPAKRERAYQTLQEGAGDSVDVLVAILSDTSATPAAIELRWTAAELLGKIGPPAKPAFPMLLVALTDNDPHVRSVAAAAIPEVDTPAASAVPALQALLATDAGRTAARALSKYKGDASPAIGDLVKMLRDASLDSETRWNAARTLGKIGPPAKAAIPELVAHLHDQAESIREHAAEALGDIGPDSAEAVPALVEVLDDPATKVRRDAVRSLGQIGKEAAPAIPAIKKLLDDPEKIVQEAAQTAIKLIGPGPAAEPEP